MRLLILSQYFWPETFIINDLARLLESRQVEVTVLTGKPNYPAGRISDGYSVGGIQRQDYEGVEVVRVPLFPRGQNSRVKLALNYLSFILSASIFGSYALRGRSFDVVFVFGVSPALQALAAMVLAWFKNAPMVVWVQDLWPESLTATGHVKNRAILAVVRFLVRAIYRRADLILVQSRAFRDPVAALCARPEKIRYYPNSYLVPPQGIPSPSAAALAENLKKSFAVLFAGNIGVAQDPETILEAARLLRDERGIRIVLVGSGSRDAWLAEQATTLRLDNLHLAGRFEPKDMSHILAAASALLVTLSAQPAFAMTVPSKVQAYLAAGRPIVAALDGEGARIIAEAKAGISVPSGQARALADAIRALHGMPTAQRDEFGANGKRYFEQNFEPQKQVDKLIGHLGDVTASRRHST